MRTLGTVVHSGNTKTASLLTKICEKEAQSITELLSKESELAMESAEESGKTVRRRSRNKIIITDDADALHDRGTYHCSGVDKVLEKFTEVKEDIYEKRIERLIFRRGWNWYGRDDLNLSRVNCPGNNFQESAYDACW